MQSSPCRVVLAWLAPGLPIDVGAQFPHRGRWITRQNPLPCSDQQTVNAQLGNAHPCPRTARTEDIQQRKERHITVPRGLRRGPILQTQLHCRSDRPCYRAPVHCEQRRGCQCAARAPSASLGHTSQPLLRNTATRGKGPQAPTRDASVTATNACGCAGASVPRSRTCTSPAAALPSTSPYAPAMAAALAAPPWQPDVVALPLEANLNFGLRPTGAGDGVLKLDLHAVTLCLQLYFSCHYLSARSHKV